MEHETKHRIKSLIEKNPEKLCAIIDNIVMEYGDEVEDFFICHIKDKKCYEEYVSYFKNFDGTKGAHFSLDTLRQKISNIDFDKKDYTFFDFAYTINMRYSDDGDLMSFENLVKSAKRYLEDPDYPGDPSERALEDAKEREEYFSEYE